MTMKFEGKKYKTVYDSHLALLEKWNAFTKNHIAKNPGAKNLLEGVLSDLLVKGRYVSGGVRRLCTTDALAERKPVPPWP